MVEYNSSNYRVDPRFTGCRVRSKFLQGSHTGEKGSIIIMGVIMQVLFWLTPLVVVTMGFFILYGINVAANKDQKDVTVASGKSVSNAI